MTAEERSQDPEAGGPEGPETGATRPGEAPGTGGAERGGAGSAGEPEAGAAAGGHEPGGAAEGEPGAASGAVPIEAVGVQELLLWFAGILAAKAWQGMGVVPDPATGTLKQDLEASRTAIDALSAIVDVIKSRFDDRVRRELEQLLTTLRLNFVEKSAPKP